MALTKTCGPPGQGSNPATFIVWPSGQACPGNWVEYGTGAGPAAQPAPLVPVPIQNAGSAIQSAVSPLTNPLGSLTGGLGSALGKLTDPNFWKGFGLILAGGAVLLIGVVAWSGRGGEAAGAAARGAV